MFCTFVKKKARFSFQQSREKWQKKALTGRESGDGALQIVW